MSKKRRHIWTPDELAEVAENCYQAVFGKTESVEAKGAVERPIPTLLPRPVRVVPTTPKGVSVSVAELRKAQRAERRRARFNKTVKKTLSNRSKELQKALKTQAKAAIAVYKACNEAHKEAEAAKLRKQAKAALALMRKVKAEAARLRKEIETAKAWLTAERNRQRHLNYASQIRIEKAKAWGIIPSWFDDED